MNTASYQHDGARLKDKNYILEFVRNNFEERDLWIFLRCFIPTLLVWFVVWLLEESFNRENKVIRKLHKTEEFKFETQFNNLFRDNPTMYV
jgi:hypothetical protein